MAESFTFSPNPEIFILRNQDEVDSFNSKHPADKGGFTILDAFDGDQGIGLIGSMAIKARNIGPDPNNWIALAGEIGPSIHASKRKEKINDE